jgi:hypothetical protein
MLLLLLLLPPYKRLRAAESVGKSIMIMRQRGVSGSGGSGAYYSASYQ